MGDATRPTIAFLLGDPAGVGPEIAAKLLADPANRAAADLLVLASADELHEAARIAGVTIPLSEIPEVGYARLADDGSGGEVAIPPRRPSAEAGDRVLHQMRRAMALARSGEVDGVVFAPLNKTSLHLAGMHEEDELRWLAKELGYTGTTSEINIIEGLWTARVTSHVAIKDVAPGITTERVAAAIVLLNDLLVESGLGGPRIGVCALNPHNGENGIFGREEIDAIAPGVAQARSLGIDVRGPYPADTIFLSRSDFDGIVTMYHDQGQIAVKLLGFDGGVTVQGGLPVIVTTPAHGTAFDIVGRGVASTRSCQNALSLAITVAGRRASTRVG